MPCTLRLSGWLLACMLGLAAPVALALSGNAQVALAGTGKVEEAKLEAALMEVMDLTPRGIREHLGLNRAIYARTSSYGHFGRTPEADGGFGWEKTDLISELKGLA